MVIQGRWGINIVYFCVVVYNLKLDCMGLNPSLDSIMVDGKVLSDSKAQN